MQLLEIKVDDLAALHAERLAQHVCVHEWVAVAITADPRPHAEEGRKLGTAPC
jgi:hypothetical protein